MCGCDIPTETNSGGSCAAIIVSSGGFGVSGVMYDTGKVHPRIGHEGPNGE